MAIIRRFFRLGHGEPKRYLDVAWDTVEKTVLNLGAGMKQETLKFHHMSDPMSAEEIRTAYRDLGYSDESINQMFAEADPG